MPKIVRVYVEVEPSKAVELVVCKSTRAYIYVNHKGRYCQVHKSTMEYVCKTDPNLNFKCFLTIKDLINNKKTK